MAVSQKDVFYALLRNHQTQAKALCKKADVSYNMLSKRIVNGTVHKLNLVDSTKLCVALDVSQTDFTELMVKAAQGEFPDETPLGDFTLPVSGTPNAEGRTIFEMLTPEEFTVIQAMRASEKKSIEAATRRLSSAGTNGNNENA